MFPRRLYPESHRTAYQIQISYATAPMAWESQTQYWVLHLYTQHGIDSYQTSERTIAFTCERDRAFASMVIQDKNRYLVTL